MSATWRRYAALRAVIWRHTEDGDEDEQDGGGSTHFGDVMSNEAVDASENIVCLWTVDYPRIRVCDGWFCYGANVC